MGLFATLLAASLSPAAAPPSGPFDRVVLFPALNGRAASVGVVLTDPRVAQGNDAAVARHAKAALREASRRGADGGVTFYVRGSKTDSTATYTGFTIRQLREIAAAKPDEGKRLAGEHAWSLSRIP